jgi:hypothetical protein
MIQRSVPPQPILLSVADVLMRRNRILLLLNWTLQDISSSQLGCICSRLPITVSVSAFQFPFTSYISALMSTGQTVNDAPGYRTLSRLAPKNWPENFRFNHCMGAILTIYAISSTRTTKLRSLFNNPFSVYFGKISFSLYLVHGPIVHMLGFWLVPRCWEWTGKDSMLRKEIGFGIAFVFVTCVVVWTADIFWRLVDDKCVSLAKRIERLVIVDE